MRYFATLLGAWALLMLVVCLLFGWAWCFWAAIQYTFLATGSAFLSILAGVSAFFMPILAIFLLSENTPND